MQNNNSLVTESHLLHKRIIDFGPIDTHKEYFKQIMLKASTFFSYVLDDIDIHIWVLEDIETYLYVNQEHASFAGKDINECIGHTISEVFDEESSSKIIEKNILAFENKKPVFTELRIKNRYGAYRMLQVKLAPKLDFSQQVVYIVGMAWDVTQSFMENRRILENELLYRTIVEDEPAYILRFNLEGNITFANTAALNFFNKKQEDFIGTSLLNYIPQCLHNDFHKQVNRFSIYEPLHYSTRCFYVRDGYHWVTFRDIASFDDLGKIKEIQTVACSPNSCNYALSPRSIYDQITRCINEQNAILGTYNDQLIELMDINADLIKRDMEITSTLRLLMDLIGYPLVILDSNLKIVKVNSLFVNLVKYSSIELEEQKNLCDFISDRAIINTIDSIFNSPNDRTVLHYPYEFTIFNKYDAEILCQDLNLATVSENRILALIDSAESHVLKEPIMKRKEIIQHIVRLSTIV